MIFFFNLLLGIYIFSVYDKRYYNSSYLTSLLLLTPFAFLWLIVIGGQKSVGTDYESYLNIFNKPYLLELYYHKGEYLFYYLILYSKKLGVSGQGFFFIFAFLCVNLYWMISRKITTRNHALFFFLFIAVSTLFHNQMNAIRQSVSIYLITISFIELSVDRKRNFFCLVLLASGFHKSSLFLYILYFIPRIKLRSSSAKFFLIIATLISLIPLDSYISDFLSFIPTSYSHYGESDYLAPISLINKITKLTLFPVFYLSTQVLENNTLNKQQRCLYIIGFISFLIKTICLISTITNRLGYFFLILSIIPVFYYLKYLKRNNSKIFTVIILYLLILYLLKIILFPTGEYLYSSIFISLF